MIIKCISLWHPWAWAMWNGLKEWETRANGTPVVAQLRKYHYATCAIRLKDYGPFVGIQAATKPMLEAIELFVCKTSPTKTEQQREACSRWYSQLCTYRHRSGWTCDHLPTVKEDYGVLGSIHKLGLD